ncbi:hypothetical protein BV898_15823 [Hypsibius exemplaris]|uniref:Uncharacterized protein n=1 Tax=Hypsibius exemplaris TaxID=2072580 RepID=A0A9X6RL49_HYPEX|nr:hypothetical protein BV898_15823 [Hypsibius exemplaris]
MFFWGFGDVWPPQRPGFAFGIDDANKEKTLTPLNINFPPTAFRNGGKIIILRTLLVSLLNVFLWSGSAAAVHFLSIHLGNVPSSGYMVMQPLFNYSLKEQAGQYPKVFENYTYEAKVNRNTPNCGPQGVETSVGLMTEIIAERTWFPNPSGLTVILAPCDCMLLAIAKLDRQAAAQDIGRQLRELVGKDLGRSTIYRRLEEFDSRTVTAVMDDLSDVHNFTP